MLAFSLTSLIGSVYVELKSKSTRPLSPGASSGVSWIRTSLLTLESSPKSSADADGTRSEATIRAARAKAGARMMRAEAGGSSYRYRGLYRGEKQTGRRITMDGTEAVEVPQRNAAAVLLELSSSDRVDPSRRMS